MKNMKKVILMITCMITMIVWCGAGQVFASAKTIDPSVLGGEENVISYVDSFITSAVAEEEDSIESYIDSVESSGYSEDASSILNFYKEIKECGEYTGTTDYSITYTEDGFEAKFIVNCSERNVEAKADFKLILSSSTNQYQAVLTSASASAIYTFGEKMEKAALNTLMGMGTVFIVLIFMSFIFSLFKYINRLENKLKSKKVEVKETASNVVEQITKTEEVEEDLVDDLELVAVITAAIAASENTSADGLVVRSIKRAGNQRWRRA